MLVKKYLKRYNTFHTGLTYVKCKFKQFLKIIQTIKTNEYVINKWTNEDHFRKKIYIASSKTILSNIVCVAYILGNIYNIGIKYRQYVLLAIFINIYCMKYFPNIGFYNLTILAQKRYEIFHHSIVNISNIKPLFLK